MGFNSGFKGLRKAKFYQENKNRYNMSVPLCLQRFLWVICQTGLYTRAGKKKKNITVYADTVPTIHVRMLSSQCLE